MHITVVTIGSHGDVQPYVALGVGLQKSGHTMRIVTHGTFESFVTKYGLEFAPLAGDPHKLVENLMQTGTNMLSFSRQMRDFFMPIVNQVQGEIFSGCQGTDAVMYTSLSRFVYHIVEKLGVPGFRSALYPMEWTREIPYVGNPLPISGRFYNKLSHILLDSIPHVIMLKQVNDLRAEFSLQPISLLPYPYFKMHGKYLPALYCFSEHVVPRPSDWGDHAHITGYWFLENQDDWQPPSELLEFIDAGEPPIYIGFGSMNDEEFASLTKIILAAIKQSGKRVVLLSGWGGLADTDLPESVLRIKFAPHDWLFSRMAAVVHHGGAGTTSAGLRAGVPSILIPFFGDQHFWGKQVHKLGVGTKPIARKNLTPEKLAAAMIQATSDKRIQQNAAQLGEKIRAEDGVSNAVKIVERYLISD